jgi:pyroglutamyl-peptidase
MASPKALGSGTARFRSLRFLSPGEGTASQMGVVLLTGFGPFPGVERNASAELAAELARRGPRLSKKLRFVFEVLPVDWQLAPVRLTDMLGQHRPAVALHFGVSARATGFVIEKHAYNATKDIVDESGQHAALNVLVPGDRPRRTATLPVRRVVRTLNALGYPTELSSDPGRYLCNAVMFHSLRYAARTEPRMRTGFIHIPATLDPGTSGEPSRIGWTDALEGGLKLLDACLTPLRGQDAILS